jgi:hypothetical protein
MKTRLLLGLLALFALLSVATAQATVSGQFQITLDPGSRTMLSVRTSAPGPITVEASLGAPPIRLSLTPEGAAEPAATAEGTSPLKLILDQTVEHTAYTLQIDNLGTTRANGRVTITYPVAHCREAAVEFKIIFSFANSVFPLEPDQCQVFLSVLRSLPDPMPQGISRVELVPRSGGVAGSYHPGLTPRIRIYGDFRGGELARIFYHEVGHHVQFAHFTNEQQARWTELHRLSGEDRDNYARLYGRENEYEDWAAIFEAYTRDSIFEIEPALKLAETGKTILLEKFKFLVRLLRHEREGQVRTYIYRTDRVGLEVAIINRASVPLDENGLPVITGEIQWEIF